MDEVQGRRIAVEHPATRWEGAYEFERSGARIPYQHRGSKQPDFASRLSADQRDRLRAAFLGAKQFGRGEQALERFFRNDPDPRFLEGLVGQLRVNEANVETERYGNTAGLIDPIARRDGRQHVRKLGDEFLAQLRRDDSDGPARRAIVQEILAQF